MERAVVIPLGVLLLPGGPPPPCLPPPPPGPPKLNRLVLVLFRLASTDLAVAVKVEHIALRQVAVGVFSPVYLGYRVAAVACAHLAKNAMITARFYINIQYLSLIH